MHAVAQKVNVQHKPKSPPVSDAKCVVLVFFLPPPDFQCQFVQLSVGQKLDLLTKGHCNDFSDFFESSQGSCKFACFSIFGFV